MKLKTWIAYDFADVTEPEKVEDITMNDLENLDFDDLISGWQTYIEDNIEKYIEQIAEVNDEQICGNEEQNTERGD